MKRVMYRISGQTSSIAFLGCYSKETDRGKVEILLGIRGRGPRNDSLRCTILDSINADFLIGILIQGY